MYIRSKVYENISKFGSGCADNILPVIQPLGAPLSYSTSSLLAVC